MREQVCVLLATAAEISFMQATAEACRSAYWAAPLSTSRPLAVGPRIKTRADFHATHGSVQ